MSVPVDSTNVYSGAFNIAVARDGAQYRGIMRSDQPDKSERVIDAWRRWSGDEGWTFAVEVFRGTLGSPYYGLRPQHVNNIAISGYHAIGFWWSDSPSYGLITRDCGQTYDWATSSDWEFKPYLWGDLASEGLCYHERDATSTVVWADGVQWGSDSFTESRPHYDAAGTGTSPQVVQPLVLHVPDAGWEAWLWDCGWVTGKRLPLVAGGETASTIADNGIDGWAGKSLSVTGWWRGRSGIEAVVGVEIFDRLYPVEAYTDGDLLLFHRPGPGVTWTGPVPIGNTLPICEPYVYERPDSVWEVGWYAADGWHYLRAAHPAGPWSAWSPE